MIVLCRYRYLSKNSLPFRSTSVYWVSCCSIFVFQCNRFSRPLLSFLSVPFGYYIVCSSLIYHFWLPMLYLYIFLNCWWFLIIILLYWIFDWTNYISPSNKGRHIVLVWFFLLLPLLLLLSEACPYHNFFVFPDRSIIFGM